MTDDEQKMPDPQGDPAAERAGRDARDREALSHASASERAAEVLEGLKPKIRKGRRWLLHLGVSGGSLLMLAVASSCSLLAPHPYPCSQVVVRSTYAPKHCSPS